MLFERNRNPLWITGPTSGIKLFSEQTEHGPLEIRECGDLRWMHFHNGSVETAMSLQEPHRLVLEYVRAMMAVLLFQPHPRSILNLGLGGGALHRFNRHYFPDARILSVENNPLVVTICQDYFELILPSEELVIANAADYLAQPISDRFDVLVTDLFCDQGLHTSLFEPRFYHNARQHLEDNGVALFNLIVNNDRELTTLFYHIWRAFDGRALCFNLSECSNVFVISFAGPPGRLQVHNLYRQAEQLRGRMHINFREYVDRIAGANTTRRGEIRFLTELE